MVNKNKVRGSNWERDLVELINDNIDNAEAKRVPGSGAIGTSLNEPELTGDLIVKFNGIPRKFRIEAKTGYGGDTQLTIKREWLNKIKEEAESTFSHPALACKFSGARKSQGVQYFVSLDFETFCDIMNYINDMKERLDAFELLKGNEDED